MSPAAKGLAVMLALIAVLVIGARAYTRSAASSAPLSQVPSLTLPALGGTSQTLAAYRGRPLFVNMWATWCPPCRAEIPDLQRLYAAEKKSGFTVVGVDQGQDEAPVAEFVSDYRLTYPILLDKTQQLAQDLHSDGLPTTLVYDRAGKLVDVVTGMMSAQYMRAELAKAQQR